MLIIFEVQKDIMAFLQLQSFSVNSSLIFSYQRITLTPYESNVVSSSEKQMHKTNF